MPLRDRLTNWGEQVRTRLPPALGARLDRYSGGAILAGTAGAGVVALLLLGLGAGAIGHALSGSADPTEAAAPSSAAAATPSASAAPVRMAKNAREPAPPAQEDEASVLLELADSLLARDRPAEVPALLGRVIARHPELKTDERLGHLLLAVASSTNRRAASEAFALLSGPSLGERGAALLYELSLKSDLPDSMRRRVERWLSSNDFDRTASLDVYAAEKLRLAKSCDDKHALLDFAGKAGGKYVVEYLHELDAKALCAPDDLEHCFPCMHADSRLRETLARLEPH